MKMQAWIFSVRYAPEGSGFGSGFGIGDRFAVVGPARASTVEAALHLAGAPEHGRAEIRSCATVHDFVEDRLNVERNGYYESGHSWAVGIGPVHEVLGP